MPWIVRHFIILCTKKEKPFQLNYDMSVTRIDPHFKNVRVKKCTS